MWRNKMCMSSQFGNIMRYDCVGIGTVLYYSLRNIKGCHDGIPMICLKKAQGMFT